jgi:dihydroneopterin aldolase
MKFTGSDLSLVYSPGYLMHMDIIYLSDLRIETIIGIYDWERRVKQTVSLDLEMASDIRKAAASDHIDDTLNYKAVAKRLISFVAESEFQLVETLAERITEIVLNEFKVPWVRLRLNKQGAVRGARDVGVIIERGTRS